MHETTFTRRCEWTWGATAEFAPTLGQTRAQQTGNLLDEGLRGDESIVLASQLLDKLLVLVEFLQVIRRHGVDTAVLGTVEIVLVTQYANGHVRARDGG